MFVLFQLPSFLFLFLLFLSRTEVYDCSLFWWLDCVIHKFWIPIFIVHHFLCEHHYSLHRLYHRMKEKYKMNAKCTDHLSTIWKFVLIQNFIEQRIWAIRNLLRWHLGGGHGDLRCCHGVAYLFCAPLRWIKSHLAEVRCF